MEQRTFLAIVLSLLLLIGYQYYYMKTHPPKPGVTMEKPAEEKSPAEPQGNAVAPGAEEAPLKRLAIEKNGGEAKDITVETPLYTAVFTTRGASLKSFMLRDYRESLATDSGPVELVSATGTGDYPLTVGFPDSTVAIPGGVLYEASAGSLAVVGGEAPRQLIFSWAYPGEVKVDKIYTFHPGKYTFDLEIKVHNLSNITIKENALVAWTHYLDPDTKADRYSHEGPVAMVKNALVTEKIKNLDERKFTGPDVQWGGYETKYFIASIVPEQPSLTGFVMVQDAANVVTTALEGPRNIIPPGQSGTFRYALYVGPKEYERLKSEGLGIERAVDLGGTWIRWLTVPLLSVLNYIYQYARNYGLAIIILTVFIKLILWPLGTMSYKSMKEMQKLQPKLKELQEKFKNDKAKLQQATMEMYRTHKINPMSGCLPLLIQIPVFFALYKVLLYSIELRHAPFYFWIHDLSAKDPYYVTPIIMGATMFIQQKMTPTPTGNDLQVKMMMWMPVIFTFLFLSFPSGLVIYWLFSNVLSIGQQYYINRQQT
ncbi:MAG: membrane protein insertase YidC [Deltaproteobacteria bacterium]|nr:membrane protein insertase YidC [Deltaproteobacteria bacterium]